VAALRISMLEQEAKVERDVVLMESSLLEVGRGMMGGWGVVTWVRVTIWVRPWDTPLIAMNVKMPMRGISFGGVGVWIWRIYRDRARASDLLPWVP